MELDYKLLKKRTKVLKFEIEDLVKNFEESTGFVVKEITVENIGDELPFTENEHIRTDVDIKIGVNNG